MSAVGRRLSNGSARGARDAADTSSAPGPAVEAALVAAAIDVGSNTVQCRVARRSPGRPLEPVADFREVTGLSRGARPTERGRLALDPTSVERTVSAVARLAERARAYGATAIAAVGTSAVREALGRDALVDAVQQRAGVTLEIADGEREAALAFKGAFAGTGLDPDVAATVVDIGGGSTELARGRRGVPAVWRSLPVGSVRCYETYLGPGAPTPLERAALERAIDRALDEALEAGSADAALRPEPGEPLVAVAGTAMGVAAIARDRPDDHPSLHGLALPAHEVRAVYERLCGLTAAARAAIPWLSPGRADVIVAGAAILHRILERWRPSVVVVSDGGVRVGRVAELLAQP
jgi:exopolyphosphatase/guanosine-5'-triphosphate,3'-diphosphate pyrophosphatase